MGNIQSQLEDLGTRYGKLGFAVSCINTILLVILLLR